MCVIWLDEMDVKFILKTQLDSSNIEDNLKQIGDIILSARSGGRLRCPPC